MPLKRYKPEMQSNEEVRPRTEVARRTFRLIKLSGKMGMMDSKMDTI